MQALYRQRWDTSTSPVNPAAADFGLPQHEIDFVYRADAEYRCVKQSKISSRRCSSPFKRVTTEQLQNRCVTLGDVDLFADKRSQFASTIAYDIFRVGALFSDCISWRNPPRLPTADSCPTFAAQDYPRRLFGRLVGANQDANRSFIEKELGELIETESRGDNLAAARCKRRTAVPRVGAVIAQASDALVGTRLHG